MPSADAIFCDATDTFTWPGDEDEDDDDADGEADGEEENTDCTEADFSPGFADADPDGLAEEGACGKTEPA